MTQRRYPPAHRLASVILRTAGIDDLDATTLASGGVDTSLVRWVENGVERSVTLSGEAVDVDTIREVATAAVARVGGPPWTAGTGSPRCLARPA